MRKILVRFGMLLPLLLYAWAAEHAAMFVPCVRILPSIFGPDSDPENTYRRTIGSTMWLLDVTTQTVRYDLVFFKEFLLLIAVCAAYTIILGCSETKRYNLRRWIDDWRQPYITR